MDNWILRGTVVAVLVAGVCSCARKSDEERFVEDLLSRMTLEEKIGQRTVLIKNNGVLPLYGKTEHNQKVHVLVTGPLAEQPKEQLGTWVFDGEPEHSVTPLKALKELEIKNEKLKIIFEPGLLYFRDKSTKNFSKTVEAAKKSDVILFFAGEEAILSGEARCRADMF